MITQSSGVVIDLTPRVKTDDLIPPGSSMLLSISTFLTDVAHTLKKLTHTLVASPGCSAPFVELSGTCVQ